MDTSVQMRARKNPGKHIPQRPPTPAPGWVLPPRTHANSTLALDAPKIMSKPTSTHSRQQPSPPHSLWRASQSRGSKVKIHKMSISNSYILLLQSCPSDNLSQACKNRCTKMFTWPFAAGKKKNNQQPVNSICIHHRRPG